MGKWIVLLIAAFVALAIVGFLIEAARALVGLALFILVIVVAVQWLRRKGSAGGGPPAQT